MRRVRQLQTNFSAGQLDPLMTARSDTRSYTNGAATLTNFMQLVQGGIKRRPGMKFLAELSQSARLVPFQFNQDQLYIFAMYHYDSYTHGHLDVYDVDGNLLDTLTNFEWTDDTLYEVRYTQRNDIAIFTHENFKTQIVGRTGATTFAKEDFTFDQDLSGGKSYEPFYAFQDPTTTIRPSDYSGGNVVLNTNVAHWTADHVGSRVSIHGQQALIHTYLNSLQVTCSVEEDFFQDQTLTVPDAYEYVIGEIITQTTTEAKGEIVDIPTSTTLKVANLKNVTFKTQSTGDATVGGLSGAAQVVSAVATEVNPLATRDWKESVFSDARGYPRSVVFHGQRLWFGGSRDLPAHLFSSKVSNFFNFDTGEALDDESIQVPIASDQVNTIQHLVSAGHLQVFTDQAEFYAAENSNQPLTPTDVNISRQSSYGCSNVRPVAFDRATLFVQNTGRVIREYKWEEIEGGYTPNAISLVASNLLDIDGIVGSSVIYGLKNRPEQFAFFLNNDGTLAVYHAARNEQISSWSKWETQGSIKSITAMEGILYALVERTINGSTKYFLEKFDEDYTLDCSYKDYNPGRAFPTTTYEDFDHLIGQLVDVVADYGGPTHLGDAEYYAPNVFYLGQYTPDSQGRIRTTDAVPGLVITAGFTFESTVKTMPVDYQAQDGQITGLPKKIGTVDLIIHSTMGAEIEGNALILRKVNDDLSKPPDAITGRQRFYLLGRDKLGQIEVKSAIPLNFTLLGLMMEVSF